MSEVNFGDVVLPVILPFVEGTPVSQSTISSEITGILLEVEVDINSQLTGKVDNNNDIEAEITGQTVNKINAEIKGYEKSESNINVEMIGAIVDNRDINAEISGWIKPSSIIEAEIITAEPDNTDIEASIHGIGTKSTNILSEISGCTNKTSDIRAEIEGDSSKTTISGEIVGGVYENEDINSSITGGVYHIDDINSEIGASLRANNTINAELAGIGSLHTYPDAELGTKWVFEIYNNKGKLLADLSGNASMRRLEVARNKPGYCTFNIDLNWLHYFCRQINVSPQNLLFINRHEVRVKRGSKYIWGGQIQRYDADISGGAISVQAVGYFNLLNYRRLDDDLSFNNVDAGKIAWSLIEITQSQPYGDFGITEGSIEKSKSRVRNYDKYKNIKEAIEQLSEVIDGFDFEIDYKKRFNVFYPKQGSRRKDIFFGWTGEQGSNIKKISIAKDGSYVINRAKMRGSGFGLAQIQYQLDDEKSMMDYDLREGVYDMSDVSLVQTLEEHARTNLKTFSQPTISLDVVIDGNQQPHVGDYWLGDEIKIYVGKYSMFEEINKYWYEIDAISISIDQNDQEEVKLTVSKL